MTSIIRVTERAAAHLRDLLMDKAKLPGQRLRLVPGPRGEVGLILDEPRAEDNIIEVDGEPLLLLHPTLTPAIRGTVLDYPETAEGAHLTLARRSAA